jgi:hypothetical protein
MDGIGQNFRAHENNTIRSTIENNSLPVLSGAWCYQTQTTKKPAVTRAYGLFLPSSARRYETLNHSHSIINDLWNLLILLCFVQCVIWRYHEKYHA